MRRTQGFAIVVVVLVLVTVFVTMLSTASVSALGARRSTAGERFAFGALLTAESGINTIGQRLGLSSFRMPLSTSTSLTQAQRDAVNLDAMNTFMRLNGLATVALPEGSAQLAAVSFQAIGNRARIAMRSVGSLPGGSARTVLEDFSMAKPPAFNISVPGALTSRAAVQIVGSAITAGIDGITSDGLVGVTTLSAAVSASAGGTGSFTARVADAQYLPVGGYIRFGSGSATYRIEAIEDTTLTLTALGTAPASAISTGTSVQLVQNGVREPVQDGLASTTVALTDVSGMAVHDTIYLRDSLGTANASTSHPGSFRGTVTAKDATTRTVAVTWHGSIPSSLNPVAEGVPLRRTVNAVTTASTTTTGGGGTMSGGVSTNDSQRVPAPPTLFEQTFGITESQLLAQTGTPIQTSWPGGVLSGLNYVRGNVTITGGSSLCGTGILIIDGSLTFNGTCSAGFVGIIYVKGDYDQQGNGFIAGAVIVEGSSKVAGTAAASSVNPTGSKIFYDPRAVLEQGTLLSPWQLAPIASTWRER
jgi:hypothetical protein